MAKKSSAAAVVNPFAVVPPLAPVVKIDKKEKKEIEIEGMELLAALQVLIKSIEGETELLQKAVKEKAIENFISQMLKTGKKPDSYLGVEAIAQASCEIRKRGSNLAVSEDAAKKLAEHGIMLEKKVNIPARYVFNPNLTQEQLMAVGEVLATNPKLRSIEVMVEENGKVVKKPLADEIVKLQPEEAYYATSDSTLDQLAATQNELLIRATVESAAVFAVGKFKLDCADPKAKAIEIAKKKGVL